MYVDCRCRVRVTLRKLEEAGMHTNYEYLPFTPYFHVFAEKTQYNRVETEPKTSRPSCKEAKKEQDYVRGV